MNDTNKPRRVCKICGKPIGPERAHNARTCSDECAKINRDQLRDKEEAAAKPKVPHEWKDIVNLCSELHISYGYYQTLEALGRLEDYIAEHRAQQH